MLQTFLQQFVPAMEEGLTLGVPLAILLVILRRSPSEEYRAAFRSALKWGFWLSIFLVAVRVGTRNAISREILEGFATAMILVAESNARRLKRFREIAQSSGVGIEAVQKRYAKKMQARISADSGVWYQDDDGSWKQK